jgi:Fe-Mn family superoxide dismutase
MEHKLPDLPYPYDALEPYYDQQTVRIHHDMHHKGYVDGLNKAEQALAQARQQDDYALIKHWEKELAFHGSGHILHALFWDNMASAGQAGPDGELLARINQDFGSLEAFKKQFSAAAAAVEGSGWAILGWNPLFQQLQILQAEKHQNLTLWGIAPVLVLDVWEHAYYLKYQNRRAEFISAWWNIVNWQEASNRFNKAIK